MSQQTVLLVEDEESFIEAVDSGSHVRVRRRGRT